MSEAGSNMRSIRSSLSIRHASLFSVIEAGGWISLLPRRIQFPMIVLRRGMESFDLFWLWFSLPLSIWLSSGWIGLLSHWTSFSFGICHLGQLVQMQETARAENQAVRIDRICVEKI
jgi:hypothetical protein